MTDGKGIKKTSLTSAHTRKNRSHKKTKPKSDRVSKVANILTSAVPGLSIEAHLREYKIKKLWPACVGEALAKNSTPLNLVKNTLNCAVSSSAWMNELNYRKGAIIKKMNSLLKEEAVTAVIFRIGAIDLAAKTAKDDSHSAAQPSKEDSDFIDLTTDKIKDAAIKDAVKKAMKAAISK